MESKSLLNKNSIKFISGMFLIICASLALIFTFSYLDSQSLEVEESYSSISCGQEGANDC